MSNVDAPDLYLIDSRPVLRNGIFDQFVQVIILGMALVVILLQVLVGISMMNTIFVFVLYGILLLYAVYLKYKYINI